MEIEPDSVTEGSVNYDDQPILQLEIGGVEYRLDTGHGSAVAVSERQPGTYGWNPLGAGKWDGRKLRVKGLDGTVAQQLGAGLGQVMSERSDPGEFG